jgi:hypothetical protein
MQPGPMGAGRKLVTIAFREPPRRLFPFADAAAERSRHNRLTPAGRLGPGAGDRRPDRSASLGPALTPLLTAPR